MPVAASRLFATLTDHERAALISRHPGRIRMAVKIPQNQAAVEIHRIHFADQPTNDSPPAKPSPEAAADVATAD